MKSLHDADAGHRVVEAAILLVADGRYPEVDVANLPDVVSVAIDLAPYADRLGVQLDLCGTPVTQHRSLKVRRR